MQRIDENTYIDDTLVTCAEYQLFIDEMREQGKYYQPDHWTSYQFPEGRAREPILGVRYKDANAFCDWLTRRDGGEWQYRLLSQTEDKNYPLQLIPKTAIGLWVFDHNLQFVMNGDSVKSFWMLSLDRDPAFLKLDSKKHLANALSLGMKRTALLDVKHAGLILNMFELDINRGVKFYDAIESKDLQNATVLGRNFACKYALNISVGQQFFNPTSRSSALDLAMYLAHSQIGPKIEFKNLTTSRVQSVFPNLKLFLDIAKLYDRVINDNNAFEGIRLVKERIR